MFDKYNWSTSLWIAVCIQISTIVLTMVSGDKVPDSTNITATILVVGAAIVTTLERMEDVLNRYLDLWERVLHSVQKPKD